MGALLRSFAGQQLGQDAPPCGVLRGVLRHELRENEAVGFRGVWGGVLKRPENREAGKVGSCDNCSAWKDAGTRRGGWGARV